MKIIMMNQMVKEIDRYKNLQNIQLILIWVNKGNLILNLILTKLKLINNFQIVEDSELEDSLIVLSHI